jgi:hypothetical protein
MGLDMYLTKQTYVKRWDHQSPEDKFSVTVEKGGKPYDAIKPERICYVAEEVAYWRKANAIHAWFVRECQGGVDDCRLGYVDTEKLKELLDTVNKVLDETKAVKGKVNAGSSWTATKGAVKKWEDGRVAEDATLAKELLPTKSGFFFGGTDYDEYYLQDLEYTRDVLTKVLAEDNSHGDFYYQSSW